MSNNPIYITPEGAQALREEFEFLWRKERPKVTQQVSEAAAMGDRSENAEYIYGKKRLREIDRRVRFLSKRLESIEVVQPNQALEGKAYFGAWVELEDEEGGLHHYRIVGTDETDTEKGYISINSPMAKALIGKTIDSEIVVNTPSGERVYELLKAQYHSFNHE